MANMQQGINVSWMTSRMRGFTIVEVAVVVVVIGILTTVGTVAFTAIQKQSRDSLRESSMTILSESLEKYYEQNGEYPSCTTLSTNPQSALSSVSENIYKAPRAEEGVTNSIICADLDENDNTDSFAYLGDSSPACVSGTACVGWVIRYREEASGEIKEIKSRYNSELAGPPSVEIAANDPIQSVTRSKCQALPTFTGSNNDAVRTVTDSRGGITRTYEIAKLADGKCWMLTNLKLGNTSPITLTSADSNVADSFILPTLTTTNNNNDTPGVYGPVPGDSGSGATNYGYAYNFPAATAGETMTSLQTGMSAPYSICPKNWRLPTGGNSTSNDFAQLDIAFGGTGVSYGDAASKVKWSANGPFKGVLSGGIWSASFSNVGSLGYAWSNSTYGSNIIYAHGLSISGDTVNTTQPGSYVNYRFAGTSIRCLLD